MGVNEKIEKLEVNLQPSLPLYLTMNLLMKENIPQKWVSSEDFNQHIEDYANLSTMFKQLIEGNAKVANENEKFKLTLEEKFTPYDANKEKEIENLKLKIEETTSRKKEHETLLIQAQELAQSQKDQSKLLKAKGLEIHSLIAKLADLVIRHETLVKKEQKIQQIEQERRQAHHHAVHVERSP